MEATEQDTNRGGGNEPSEIAQVKEELRREHDLYLRAMADFENYRRRIERDRASAVRSGKREIVLPLLEILDGFDVAVIDLMLSGASTLPFAEKLREARLPFVFASGYAEEEGLLAFPGVPVVSKPYSGNDLIQAIAAVAARR